MTAKIVRVLLVFTTILILGFYLPDLFRSRFEKRAGKRLLYYSEVKRDFVFSEGGVRFAPASQPHGILRPERQSADRE